MSFEPLRSTRRHTGQHWAILFIVADLLFTEFALFAADFIRRRIPLGMPINQGDVYLTARVLIVTAVIWLAVFYVWGAYRARNLREPEAAIKTTFFATTFSVFTLASFFYFLKIQDFSRLLFGYFYLIDLSLLIVSRLALGSALTRIKAPGYGTRRVAIVGSSDAGIHLAERMMSWSDYAVVGFIGDSLIIPERLPPLLGPLREVERIIEMYSIDEIIVAPLETGRQDLANLIICLSDQAVKIRLIPDLLEMLTVRTRIENLRGVSFVQIREPGITGLQAFLKRCLDLVGATLGLLVSAPLMALITVLIKIDSPGPVLFVQERASQYGKPFRMYKFRSMVPGAEKQTEDVDEDQESLRPKHPDDPRVTRIGRWLRRLSLDELPQLINVLRGEMSLVGPRPEEVQVVQRYDAWQSQRLLVKPGITGSMQISGRANLSLEERVALELAYIDNYSLFEDFRILARTIPAVLSGKGAY